MVILPNIIMSLSDRQCRFSSTYFKYSYITIIFGVTVVNEARQAGKTKVGVQIVARIWQENAAAHPFFLSYASAGTNSNNNDDHFMRKTRHFFSPAFSGYRTSSILIFTLRCHIGVCKICLKLEKIDIRFRQGQTILFLSPVKHDKIF